MARRLFLRASARPQPTNVHSTTGQYKPNNFKPWVLLVPFNRFQVYFDTVMAHLSAEACSFAKACNRFRRFFNMTWLLIFGCIFCLRLQSFDNRKRCQSNLKGKYALGSKLKAISDDIYLSVPHASVNIQQFE